VAELSAKTRIRIEFDPYSYTKGDLYDYHLVKSDIWRLLVFLDQVGTVKVNGTSFDKLRKLQREIKDGQPIAIQLSTMPAQEIAEWLSFMSGMRVSVISGDPTKPISVETRNRMRFSDVLEQIKRKTGITMEATEVSEED